MSFKANKKELAEFFTKSYKPELDTKVSPIKDIIIDMQKNNPHLKTGTGRIKTNLKDFAFFCIKKDGPVKLFFFLLAK